MAHPNPPIEPAEDPTAAGQVPPTPDEDGPHDVPDDTVIEKTLPERPGRPGGDRSPG